MKNAPLISTKHFDQGVLPRRAVVDGQFLEAGDPAIHAITDFTREHPATVDEERQIDDALEDMVRLGVRALLVVRDQRVVGLLPITPFSTLAVWPIAELNPLMAKHVWIVFNLLLLIPLAWMLAFHTGLGPNGVYVAVLVSDSLLAVLSILLFRRGKWTKVTV